MQFTELFRSTDDGRSWAPVAFPFPATDCYVAQIAGVNPANPDEIVVTACRVVARSTDGGLSWSVDEAPQLLDSATVDWSTRRVYALAYAFDAILRRPLDASGAWQATQANARLLAAGHGIVLYAGNPSPAVAGALYRSVDQGATFTKVADASPTDETLLAIAVSSSPMRMYAVDRGRVLRSDDGGASWTTGATFDFDEFPWPTTLAVDAGNVDRVYVTTARRGVLVSANAGATFAPLDHASGAPGRARSIALDAVDPSRQWLVAPHLSYDQPMLERSEDGGATWTASRADVLPVAASRQRSRTLFGVDGLQNFLVSDDDGASWTPTLAFPGESSAFQALGQGGTPSRLIVSSTDYDVIASPGRMFVSSDDGQTFVEQAPVPVLVRAIGIAPSAAAIVYAGGLAREAGGPILWKSTDGAATWQPLGAFAPHITTWQTNDVYAIAVDPRDPARAYVGFVYPDNLMRTDDGGATWTRATTGLGAGAVTSIAIDPANPDVLYAGVYLSGVFRSTNRGQTWTALDAGLDDDAVRQVLLDPHRPGRLYAGTNSGMYKVDLATGLPAGYRRAVEYYHGGYDHYFVSADVDEIAGLDAGAFFGWVRTGYGIRVAEAVTPGNQATCRFYGIGFGTLSSHFYTPYPGECDGLKTDPNWKYEKVAFGLALPDETTEGCAPGTRPLFRTWNRNARGAPNHRYTTIWPVHDRMRWQDGWQFEGEASTQVFACVPA
jgi:photosystem II stability/assembly factor-like uncharacterized protein